MTDLKEYSLFLSQKRFLFFEISQGSCQPFKLLPHFRLVLSQFLHLHARYMHRSDQFFDEIEFSLCNTKCLSGHVHANPFSLENATLLIRFQNIFRPHYSVFESFLPSTPKRETTWQRWISQAIITLGNWNEGHMLIMTSAFSRNSVLAINTTTGKRRFQKLPLW